MKHASNSRAAGLIAAAAAAIMAAAPASADISDGVVRIGVMNDQSGPYADNCGAGSVATTRIAIEDAAAALGRVKVEVLIADDQNKPDIGVAQALKWVEQDGVDAIVGCSASSIALAVTDVMRAHGKPYLIAGTATSETTNSKCSPMNTNWSYDTYTLAKGSVEAQLAQGLDTWYFITVDYTFGKQWQADATRFIEAAGGKVLGSTLHPLGASDFSSQLLQAQASGAKVIGIANAGGDLANVIKQAREFGIAEAGQAIAPLGLLVNNVHAIGLQATQGLHVSSSAYWDQNDETRAFAERYAAAYDGRVPNEAQLTTYSAVNHYLKAVAQTGSDDGEAVMAAMKATPVDDMTVKGAKIRADGALMRPMLSIEVKAPADSSGPWDYYKVLGEIPAEKAWRPVSESSCPLLK